MSNDENTPIEPIDVKPELPLVPSTSSDATDTTAPTVYADDIFEGARYRDYHHFRAVLTAFEKRTHTAYKIDGSSKLYSKDHPDIVAKYEYQYVNVKCVHFGVARVRSQGLRCYTKHKPIGCESRMKLHYRWATQDMELTRGFLHHNHVCGPPQLDAKGKEQLPEVIGYSPEIVQLLAEFKGSRARRGGRPTPYSRPARAPLAEIDTSLPLASDQHLDSEDESGNHTLPMTSTQNQNAVSEDESDDNTQQTVSTEASPSLERLNQELFNFMNPESEAERIQRLRNQMMAQIKFIHDSIPQHETQKRNEVAMQLMPILKIFLNPPTVLSLEQIANEMSRQ